MNNIALARSYIRQTKERIKHAGEALETGNYPYVIRQCQEAVELALKAALRIVGIEPPKWHDVGPVLRREKNRFPDWFQERIPELAYISRSLRKERETAMYGDEETGLPAEELYTLYDAEQALKQARTVLYLVEKLLREAQDKQ
ncbi:HEPN domain-containing protein [Staphylothermus hellenicus]|uniref:HEPN domain protein n=1 Tax=Staphylothermus hellenicus (strain DSM 12710 / JCM 10830 / BK20S6-10-b1 / P8) TaxID=591019 RepID=D7DAP6_STAHD|nr:HEPN domain-containing protein [Staphylothermus hellenicus]ADI31243.1 HEPN domain protein [Staphylothermus hellenicus DSM 12710]